MDLHIFPPSSYVPSKDWNNRYTYYSLQPQHASDYERTRTSEPLSPLRLKVGYSETDQPTSKSWPGGFEACKHFQTYPEKSFAMQFGIAYLLAQIHNDTGIYSKTSMINNPYIEKRNFRQERVKACDQKYWDSLCNVLREYIACIAQQHEDSEESHAEQALLGISEDIQLENDAGYFAYFVRNPKIFWKFPTVALEFGEFYLPYKIHHWGLLSFLFTSSIATENPAVSIADHMFELGPRTMLETDEEYTMRSKGELKRILNIIADPEYL